MRKGGACAPHLPLIDSPGKILWEPSGGDNFNFQWVAELSFKDIRTRIRFQDTPHIQLKTGHTLAEARQLVKARTWWT